MLLNILRRGAKHNVVKFLLFGILLLAVFGLVLTDAGGFFRSGVGNTNVARIGGQDISAPQFDQLVRNVLSRQGVDAQTAYQLGLINRILDSEVSNNLLYRSAHDSGINISDEVIAEQVRKLIAPYVTSDMTAKQAFQRILMNQGMTEAQFVRALRMEMANAIMRNALQLSNTYISDSEVRDLYLFQNEERTVKALVFPHNAVKDYQEPTDEVLLPFYQAGKERYAIPETRQFTVATLSSEDFKKTMAISDEELEQTYKDEIAGFSLPEQRRLEQCVVADQSVAQAIADKAKGGAGLKQAVKSATGSENAYIGTQDFQQDGLAEAIGKAAFTAQKGDVIGPVQTPLGWHVLVLKDVLPPKVKSFAEVKDQLHKGLLQSRLADQMFAISGTIDDQLASGTPLEDVAKEQDMKIVTFGPVHADGSTAESKEGLKGFEKDQAVLLKTAFEIEEGESAPVMELSDGRYATVRVDKINEKSYKPFEGVKADLRKVWVSDQQMTLNQMKAQAVLQTAQGGGKTLDVLAKENGMADKTMVLKRGGEAEAPLTAEAKAAIFGLSLNDVTLTSASDGYIVAQVTESRLPVLAKASADDLKKTRETLQQSRQDETMLAFVNYLNEKYNVKINQDLLMKMYGPGSETN